MTQAAAKPAGYTAGVQQAQGSLGPCAPSDLSRGYCKPDEYRPDDGYADNMPASPWADSVGGFLDRPQGWER